MISFTVGVGGLGRHYNKQLGLNITRAFNIGLDETGVYLGMTIDSPPASEQATLALDDAGQPYIVDARPEGLLIG